MLFTSRIELNGTKLPGHGQLFNTEIREKARRFSGNLPYRFSGTGLSAPSCNFAYLYRSKKSLVSGRIALLLLVLIGFRTAGYLAISLARLHAAREDARAALYQRREKQVETFVFSLREFHERANGSREFWHEGRLFDIQKISLVGDSVHIMARADDRERNLLTKLRSFFPRTGERAPASGPASWWVQLVMHPFLPANMPPSLTLACHTAQTPPPCWAERIPGSIKPGITAPPPERG